MVQGTINVGDTFTMDGTDFKLREHTEDDGFICTFGGPYSDLGIRCVHQNTYISPEEQKTHYLTKCGYCSTTIKLPQPWWVAKMVEMEQVRAMQPYPLRRA